MMREKGKRTVSEILFEEFCGSHRIPLTEIAERTTRTPDYEIRLGEHLVIVEAKQVDRNSEDEDHRRKILGGEDVGFFEPSANRVRKKIDRAAGQFKAHSGDSHPTMLVLYDNVSPGTIDATDIKAAMYGDETAILRDHRVERTLLNQKLGEGRTCTPNTNTTISAVALLYRWFAQSLWLSIFENVYAKNPIDPSWLECERVRYFTLDPEEIGCLPEWREVTLHAK